MGRKPINKGTLGVLALIYILIIQYSIIGGCIWTVAHHKVSVLNRPGKSNPNPGIEHPFDFHIKTSCADS